MTKVYLVGGAVRDLIRGIPCNDKDRVVVGVEYIRESVTDFLKSQGVLTFRTKGKDHYVFDDNLKTARGRNDHGLILDFKFIDDLKSDLTSRDITINSLAVDESTGNIIDYVGGLQDIEDKLIRYTGNAAEKIKASPERLIRVARFSQQLKYDLTLDTQVTYKNDYLINRLRTLDKNIVVQQLNKWLHQVGPIDFMRFLTTYPMFKDVVLSCAEFKFHV